MLTNKQKQNYFLEEEEYEDEIEYSVPQQVTIIHNHFYGDINHTIHINDKRNK